MFQLKILTDLSKMPKVVETNIDEVQPVIDAAIAKLDGLEVTDNKAEIVAADDDAAKLRKMRDAIKRFRIDNIALWKEPLAKFEAKCKESETKLDEAANKIAAKTNEVKDLWRTRKREKCAAVWEAKLAEAFADNAEAQAAPHFKAFFELWTNPKTKGTWCNSSVAMSTVEQAMAEEIARVQGVIEATQANYANEVEEVKAKAMLALYQRFDIADTIKAVNDWKAEQAAIAERAEKERQRVAEENARMQAAKANLAVKRAASGQGAPVPAERPTATTVAQPEPAKADTPPAGAEVTETYRLAITGTRAALAELKQYGLKLGIIFTNLDK